MKKVLFLSVLFSLFLLTSHAFAINYDVQFNGIYGGTPYTTNFSMNTMNDSGKTASQFYNYNETTFYGTPPTASADTAAFWIYEDPLGDINLSMIFDIAGDSSAGSMDINFSNMPSATRILSDDGSELKISPTDSSIWTGTWVWYTGRTDGGIIKMNEETWSINLDITGASNISTLAFYSGGWGTPMTIISYAIDNFSRDNEIIITASGENPQVPEPASMLILGSVFLGIFSFRRKKA